ncbi:3prime-5prime exonuclease [Popillia japonica]|uniref:3prime-5prime exonuclease n=1 Tax=Popillia japonica TaxID=7064 RepID=A0AAW1MIB3_POPJA
MMDNYNFKRGERLILELLGSPPDNIIAGEVVDCAEHRIALKNMSTYGRRSSSNVVIHGPYQFYRPEILSIRVFKNEDDDGVVVEESKDKVGMFTKSHKTPQSNAAAGINCKDTILIDKVEYERLKDMSHNYIYISCFDSRYYDAMNYIESCETIGVADITTSYEKFARINLIIISTWDQVYIFDFLVLLSNSTNKFPTELEVILKHKDIKKILHDSRLLTLILSNQYNIHIKNIFDTKVADVAARKKLGEATRNKQTRTLEECLKDYFNFPPILNIQETIKLDRWSKRPLSEKLKFQAAQSAAFLILLKNHLENILLKDFYQCVTDYAYSLQQCSAIDVPKKILNDTVCDILENMKLS